MKFISLFETITRSKVKDCFEDSNSLLNFIVCRGEIGKAIGKAGSNAKKIEAMLKRKIKIVEHNEDLIRFTGNLIYPLKATEISLDDETLTITGPDTQTKAQLIGRNSQNLKNFEQTIRRYFPIKALKVQ